MEDKKTPSTDGEGSPVAAILLRMKEKGEKPGRPMDAPAGVVEDETGEMPGDEQAASGDLMVASEDLVAAVQQRDPALVASAFQAMFDIAMSKHISEGGEPEDMEMDMGPMGKV